MPNRAPPDIIFSMSWIKAHFDGTAVVLDEPASLAVGQQVRVITDPSDTAALLNGDDESAALHIDPLDAVPASFVRRPGSAAGQIKMADDFNATPDDFEEYL
jgi:hypothetical protein